MRRKVLSAQYVSRMCAVCGTENAASLGAHFFELEGRELLGVFHATESHQGYPGRLHGGMATALLDEAIGRAITMHVPDAWGVTVEISVRFKRPVPVGGEVRAVARIVGDPTGRIFEGAGEIVLPDGTVAVEATGRYLKMSIDKISAGDLSTEQLEYPYAIPDFVDIS